MYSIMRRIGRNVTIFRADITTLEEAYYILSQGQKTPSKNAANYYIQQHRREAKKPNAKSQSATQTMSATGSSNGPRTSPKRRQKGIKHRGVRIQGKDSFAVKGGFQSLDEACEHALEMQKQTSDSTITHQVEYTPSNKVNTPITTHHNEPKSARASQHSPLNTGHLEGSRFSVIRERYGVQERVRGGFQTQSEAHTYGLNLLRKTSDRNVQYYVEYIDPKQDVISIPIRDGHQEQKLDPRQKRTKARRKTPRQRRSQNWDKKNHARDDYYPRHLYYSGELLGLGIPAQTGHGRRSRRWFNDL